MLIQFCPHLLNGVFKMSGDFSDTRNSLTFNTSDDSQESTFRMSDIDHLAATSGSSIDYKNSIRMDTSSNKPIISVARRNERERKRVRLVNQGFAILRDRVPRDRCTRGRRSSKVETLRAAIMYIRQLQQLLLESQMRYQTQDMTQCYTHVGDNSFLCSPVTSVCESYGFSNEYTQSVIQEPSYPLMRGSVNIQSESEVYDHHLAVPWFA